MKFPPTEVAPLAFFPTSDGPVLQNIHSKQSRNPRSQFFQGAGQSAPDYDDLCISQISVSLGLCKPKPSSCSLDWFSAAWGENQMREVKDANWDSWANRGTPSTYMFRFQTMFFHNQERRTQLSFRAKHMHFSYLAEQRISCPVYLTYSGRQPVLKNCCDYQELLNHFSCFDFTTNNSLEMENGYKQD